MTVSKALRDVRYVVDSEGRRTDAIIPLAAWTALLNAWCDSLEKLEDQEDRAILLEWLENRAAGKADLVPLEQLEQDLVADGLV